MFGKSGKAAQPETCAVPLGGRPDGPRCGLDIRGGAIFVGDNNERTPVCHSHMQAFLRALLIGLEEYANGA